MERFGKAALCNLPIGLFAAHARVRKKMFKVIFWKITNINFGKKICEI